MAGYRIHQSIKALAVGVSLCTAWEASHSEAVAQTARQEGASARLNVEIRIPAFIRLIDNQHPQIVATQALQSTVVTQRLEVQSNLKNGFCIFLRQSMPEALQWRVSTVNGRSDMAQPIEDGYQVCVRQPGRQTLELTHSFESSQHRRDVAIAEQVWPITTDLLGL